MKNKLLSFLLSLTMMFTMMPTMTSMADDGFNVTFKDNYSWDSYDTIYETVGTNYNLPYTNPSRTGYDFAGWYTQSTGGSEVTSSTIVSESDVRTLYAHWDEHTATLKYHINGHGKEADKPADVTMKYSERIYAAPSLSETGYNFNGWNTSPNGTGTTYYAGSTVKYADTEPTETNLYAMWSPITVTFYLDYNSGYYWEDDSSVGVTFDAMIPNLVPPTRSGYVFNGYWDESKKERIFDADGKPLQKTVSKYTQDQYLTACWEDTEHIADHENSHDGLNVEIYHNKSKNHLAQYYMRNDKITHKLYYDINETASDTDSATVYIKPKHQAYEHGDLSGDETIFTDAPNDVTMLIYLPNSMRDADRIQVKHIKDDGTVYYKDEQVRFGEYIKFENANGFDKFVLSTKKFDEPMFVGKSLILGGDIGVNFYMDIPDDATDGQMVFKVSGKDGYTISADGVYVPEKKLYKFTCNLNSLKMADKIIAEYKYNGYSIPEEYSIAEYLKQEEEEGSSLMKTLAAKMHSYGFYAQEYLAQVHSETVKFGDGDDKYKKMSTPSGTPETSLDLNKYSIDVSGDSSDISGEPEISLTLDSQVGLKLYLPLSSDSDYEGNIPNVTVDGEELDASNISFAENKGIKFMIISINNIPTSMLGHTYEVVVDGNYTLKSSALTYANALLKNGATDEAKKLGAALYEYYEAAMNYAGLDVE